MKKPISNDKLYEHIISTESTRDMKKFIYKIMPIPYLLFVIKDLQSDIIFCKRRYIERTGCECMMDDRGCKLHKE